MNTVLFTASTYSHIQHFHLPYLHAFSELGWKVHVACGSPPASVSDAEHVFCLPFVKKMSSPENFRAQRMLRDLMRENDYSLVCTHTSLAAYFTRRAAAGLTRRPPVVDVVHGYLFDRNTPVLKKSVLLAAEKFAAPQTDLLLTMNSSDYAAAVNYKLARHIRNIPGIGFDPGRFHAADPALREEMRGRYSLSPSSVVMIFAAEFSGNKNQSALIRGLTLLPENFYLALPGGGKKFDECRALAAKLGMSERIIFPGAVGDMVPWYSMADIAVSSSRSEGLPFNIMEAMSCGLPVVASNVKGNSDLIDDGRSGLLYPFDDAEAFSAQIMRLYGDKALWQSAADAARLDVEAYSINKVLPLVMEAYLSASKAKDVTQ